MKKNNNSRYLKYAITEVFLVVIGILIALSIDNWNEDRKNQVFQEEILTQMRSNLIKDKTTLSTIKLSFEKAIIGSNKVLKPNWSLKDKDSLKYWLGDIIKFDRFQPLTNAYDVLKSRGIDKITENAYSPKCLVDWIKLGTTQGLHPQVMTY